MTNRNEQAATKVLRRVLEFDKKMKERLDDEFRVAVTMREANTHHVRSVIRKALDETASDHEACRLECEKIAQANNHVQGETVACRFCQELNTVYKENSNELF